MHEVTTNNETRVSVRLAYKVNMGNYENLDVEFAISSAVLLGESAATAADRVYALTEKKLIEKVNEVKDSNSQ